MLLVALAISAYTPSGPRPSPRQPAAAGMIDRRTLLPLAATALGALVPAAASAAGVQPCAKNANNCWSTASQDKTAMKAWAWPASMSRKDAIASLRKNIDAYPQAGQDGVDAGGWSYAVDELDAQGSARLEFKSGLGNMARFFNNNKPFVDDLEFAIADGRVDVRSSSRIGDSDLGVNAKRLNYIAAALRKDGWDAPSIQGK